MTRLPDTQAPRWIKIGFCTSLIVIAFLSGVLLYPDKSNTKHPYIAKRLFVSNPNDIIINFTDLRTSLRSYVEASPEKIGVFFEYLPTGVTINVNGNDDFFRASLVKLPVVMRAYKFIETKQLSLDDVLTIEEKQLNKDFGTLWQRGAGTQLTVRELIRLILDDSDNTAFNVLYERVNVQLLQNAPNDDQAADDVYDYLDIPRAAEGITPMVTPRNYTSILKSLYFSAYLPFDSSNEILQTMTAAHSEKWLREPIPETIPVANKIGAYIAEPENFHVFSDCGIIYYPERPYTLCVMVNSDQQSPSEEHIRNISRLVYDYLQKAKDAPITNK